MSQRDNMMDNTTLTNLLLYCGVPLLCLVVVLTIAALWALRVGSAALDRFIDVDTEKMQEQYAKLQAKNPGKTQAQLVEQFVHGQALKCGLLGALTSFGGLITLPITLPIDLVASVRIQATMVEFIAAAYGHTLRGKTEQQIQSYLIMTGGLQASEGATRLIMRMVVRLLGQTFAKFVPFFGAIVGFIVNYSFTRAAGRVAVMWYSGRKAA
jgi:uncharacterized protein (DUF697 family)